MTRAITSTTAVRGAFLAAAAFALSACGETAELEYEADAVDQSGAELIVEDEGAAGVDVELPDTPMTNVPAEGMESSEETPVAE